MDNRSDFNKAILVLIVIFFASILKGAITGTLSSAWIAFAGAIIIGLSLSAMLVPGEKRGSMLDDH